MRTNKKIQEERELEFFECLSYVKYWARNTIDVQLRFEHNEFEMLLE